MDNNLRLHLGEERQLHLPGLGSAGYAWNWELSSAGVVAVRLESGTAAHAAAEGCSAPQILSISALQSGCATLQLSLRRPFSDRPPREQHRIEIEVLA
ncbi:MAG: protease inhibitor I42 family protein [Burkholderiales bacterium]|nr:protease inhibitor I42 family protein [Burkholderiales bacterium]